MRSVIFRYVLGTFTLALIGSCSHSPSALERFHDMEPERQQIYIAYYPELSHEQRKELLEGERHPYHLLRRWGKDTRWFVADESASDETIVRWQAPRSAYALRSLEIQTDRGTPILRGMGLNARAILHYEDGRQADATLDVRWSATPHPRVKVKEGKVEFGCLHEEITLSAEFLDERKQTLAIPVLKPIKSFVVTLDDPAQGFRADGYLELAAKVSCEDGSSERVTCQTAWSTNDELGEVVGCGQYRAFHSGGRGPASDLLKSETIRAHYGDREARLRVQAPDELRGGRKTAPTVSR